MTVALPGSIIGFWTEPSYPVKIVEIVCICLISRILLAGFSCVGDG
jgi:hypothetical protein